MTQWTPAQWTVFFASATTLVGAITTSIIAIIRASRAEASAARVSKALLAHIDATKPQTGSVRT